LEWDGVGRKVVLDCAARHGFNPRQFTLELAKIGTRQRYARGATAVTVLMILLLFGWRTA
jgi:hypothetical protein